MIQKAERVDVLTVADLVCELILASNERWALILPKTFGVDAERYYLDAIRHPSLKQNTILCSVHSPNKADLSVVTAWGTQRLVGIEFDRIYLPSEELREGAESDSGSLLEYSDGARVIAYDRITARAKEDSDAA